MIAQLTQNQPTLIASFGRLTTIYIKQYGAGNLRIGTNKEDLFNTVGATVQDGIAQATANGWQQYFWDGDLWIISDQNGPVVLILPSYQFNINRSLQQDSPNSVVMTERGNLSTYGRGRNAR